MTKTAFALVLTIVSATSVHASAKMLGSSGDWGIYSFQRHGERVCYVLSVPKDARPPGVDHGRNYFLIAPAEGADRREPEAIMGYPLKAGSLAKLLVGDKTFQMFTKEKNAWVNDTARAPELMEALKAGSTMVLQATSARGTHTSYTYSLNGITAALDKSRSCNHKR